MSWETATDTLIAALNELHFSNIEDVGIPADFPNLEGGTPKTYISESRARFDYGNQNYLDRAITSRALNNVVVVFHLDDIPEDQHIHTVRQYYQDIAEQIRTKIEEKEISRGFQVDKSTDGKLTGVGFSASVIDVQPNHDPTRPIAWVWIVIEVRAFH